MSLKTSDRKARCEAHVSLWGQSLCFPPGRRPPSFPLQGGFWGLRTRAFMADVGAQHCPWPYTHPPECNVTYAQDLGRTYDVTQLIYIVLTFICTVHAVFQTVALFKAHGYSKLFTLPLGSQPSVRLS